MAGFGLQLVRSAGMEGFTGNTFEFPIDPTNTNPIFTGDAVNLAATGFLQEATGGANNNDFDILGTFMGCHFVDAEGGVKFRRVWSGEAGATEIMGQVAIPAHHSHFFIRGTEGATYTRANTVGKRFGLTFAAGRAAYGDSAMTMAAVTATTGPLLVRGLAPYPGNVFGGDEPPIFEVVIARQQAAA